LSVFSEGYLVPRPEQRSMYEEGICGATYPLCSFVEAPSTGRIIG